MEERVRYVFRLLQVTVNAKDKSVTVTRCHCQPWRCWKHSAWIPKRRSVSFLRGPAALYFCTKYLEVGEKLYW